MQYQFGQQKRPAQMTNAQAEKALVEQVAEAEKQRKVPAVVPPTGRWKDWMTGLLGLACVGLLVAVVLQRRAR